MLRSASFVLLVSVAALAGCSSPEPAEQPQAVLAQTVAVDAQGAQQSLNGVVAANIEATLSFRVPGQITERFVKRGEFVRKGQPLARLDVSDYRLSADQARSQAEAAERDVQAAQILAARAISDDKRQAGLVASGSLSAQAYDATKAAAETAKANLAAAKARASAARLSAQQAANQSRYTTLVADGDGTVADFLAEPGQVVAAGQPVLTLARSGLRDIVVAVPETMRARLPQQGTVTVAATGENFEARLKEVTASADPVTRSFQARYTLSGSNALLPGVTATLYFQGASTGTQRILVPLGAVIDKGKGPSVWIIGRDMVLSLRQVRLGAVRDHTIEVVAGLKGGERIVAAGAHALNQGQKVRIGSLPR